MAGGVHANRARKIHFKWQRRTPPIGQHKLAMQRPCVIRKRRRARREHACEVKRFLGRDIRKRHSRQRFECHLRTRFALAPLSGVAPRLRYAPRQWRPRQQPRHGRGLDLHRRLHKRVVERHLPRSGNPSTCAMAYITGRSPLAFSRDTQSVCVFRMLHRLHRKRRLRWIAAPPFGQAERHRPLPFALAVTTHAQRHACRMTRREPLSRVTCRHRPCHTNTARLQTQRAGRAPQRPSLTAKRCPPSPSIAPQAAPSRRSQRDGLFILQLLPAIQQIPQRRDVRVVRN